MTADFCLQTAQTELHNTLNSKWFGKSFKVCNHCKNMPRTDLITTPRHPLFSVCSLTTSLPIWPSLTAFLISPQSLDLSSFHTPIMALRPPRERGERDGLSGGRKERWVAEGWTGLISQQTNEVTLHRFPPAIHSRFLITQTRTQMKKMMASSLFSAVSLSAHDSGLFAVTRRLPRSPSCNGITI